LATELATAELATIHPEPILENQSKEIIEFDVFLLDLKLSKRLVDVRRFNFTLVRDR
jgi:hypothetical protein